MMAGIRSKDTKPELLVRRFLHSKGLRFRLGGRGLPGRPDLVFGPARTVVFVHGCFWHRHADCRYTTTPATRVDFWTSKFDQNVSRDARTTAELQELGWVVEVIWSCEVDDPRRLEGLAERIAARRP